MIMMIMINITINIIVIIVIIVIKVLIAYPCHEMPSANAHAPGKIQVPERAPCTFPSCLARENVLDK